MSHQHVTHYLYESGWPDDYVAGCHVEEYKKSSSRWERVTCKHCLRNEARRIDAANAVPEPHHAG